MLLLLLLSLLLLHTLHILVFYMYIHQTIVYSIMYVYICLYAFNN